MTKDGTAKIDRLGLLTDSAKRRRQLKHYGFCRLCAAEALSGGAPPGAIFPRRQIWLDCSADSWWVVVECYEKGIPPESKRGRRGVYSTGSESYPKLVGTGVNLGICPPSGVRLD